MHVRAFNFIIFFPENSSEYILVRFVDFNGLVDLSVRFLVFSRRYTKSRVDVILLAIEPLEEEVYSIFVLITLVQHELF